MTFSGTAKSISATQSGITSLSPNLFHFVLLDSFLSIGLSKLCMVQGVLTNYTRVDSNGRRRQCAWSFKYKKRVL